MVDQAQTDMAALNAHAQMALKFLSLYECLTNPEHTELLIQTIGDWLGDDDGTLVIETLERHSEKILNLTISTLADAEGKSAPTRQPTYFTRTTAPNVLAPRTVEQNLGVSFLAQDALDFRHWVKGQEQARLFRVVDGNGRGHLCLADKSELPESETEFRFWLNDAVLAEATEELLIRDLELSHSEILVLREIAFGSRRSDIAEKLGKSGETIRSQIKSIANKMGVSGQIEIAAELRNLETQTFAQRAILHGRPADARRVELPDGRALEYLDYGPDTGQPILFFHCFLHGKHLPASIGDTLGAMNYRVISMSRAGFGGSSMRLVRGTNTLENSALDYHSLCRLLDLGRCHLLAHATGFASAFHFAAKYPELTRKVLGLDPVPPINRFSDMKKLLGLFRAAALTMSKAPSTFLLMNRFAMRRLNSFDDTEKTFRRHILYPSVELERLETSEGIAAGTRNVQDMKANQLLQCVDEARAFRADWSKIGPDSNRRPELVLFHTKDNPFVSATGSRDFARALDCDLVELGETFPFLEPHLKSILSKLN